MQLVRYIDRSDATRPCACFERVPARVGATVVALEHAHLSVRKRGLACIRRFTTIGKQPVGSYVVNKIKDL